MRRRWSNVRSLSNEVFFLTGVGSQLRMESSQSIADMSGLASKRNVLVSVQQYSCPCFFLFIELFLN